MKEEGALRSLCLELSSDSPSPGGGTAAAAAGAMAASLLAMVCGITAKKKKYEARRAELERLLAKMGKARDDLVRLAREDAESYDAVILASKRKRDDENPSTIEGLQQALKQAAETPLRTASTCAEILESASRVVTLATPSASSDVGVAVLLAEAGFRGAAMNVNINLLDISDASFVKSARARLKGDEKRVRDSVDDSLSRLSSMGRS